MMFNRNTNCGSGVRRPGRFQLGKDLLAIILGVLRTILGFYYGSAGFGTAAPQALTISELAWNQESLPSGSKASIAGKLPGGTPPYRLFHALPDALADGIAAVPRRAPVPLRGAPPAGSRMPGQGVTHPPVAS